MTTKPADVHSAASQGPLLPCPFCGGDAVAYHDGALWWGLCEDCGAEGPVSDDERRAKEKWNARAAPLGGEADKTSLGDSAVPSVQASPINEAQTNAAHGWVSVEERLPPKGEPVLIGGQWTPRIDVLCEDAEGLLWGDIEDWPGPPNITHWMPLPPAPGAAPSGTPHVAAESSEQPTRDATQTNEQDERKAFEAWVRSVCTGDPDFASSAALWAWAAWQARAIAGSSEETSHD